MATYVSGWVIYFDVIAITLIRDNINHYPDSLFLNLIAAATSGYILYWLPIQTTYYVLPILSRACLPVVADRKF